MAEIKTYSYCNASIGKTVDIQFSQGLGGSYTIVGHIVGGNCNSAQPQIIAVIPSPTGLAVSGYLEPINVAPYARYIEIGGTVNCGGFQFDDITVGNATNNLTADGSLIIEVVGQALFTTYQISGPSGTIVQAWTPSTTTPHIFTGLKPGVYTVTVKTTTYAPFGGSQECVIQDEVIVGQNAVICDLGIGSVLTEPAQGAANGSITILNLTGYQAAVEYRLDAGAWQDSPIFNGLAAGTYSVQARYKDYVACVAFKDVNVLDDDSCDLSISVLAVHEQSKFAEDGVIQITANGSQGPYLYSIDDGDNYQSDSIFTGLAPGVYPVRVQDAAGCEDVQVVTIYRYKKPFIYFPKINSHRIILQTSPTLPLKKRQNFENTLFREMKLSGTPKGEYYEKVETDDVNALQFQSSYLNNYIKVYDESDDSLLATYSPNRISQYMNLSETLAAMFVNLGGGKVQVFFENGLPYYAEIGMILDVTDNVTLNGSYEVEDITEGVGLAEGYQVLIITAASVPLVVSGTATFDYDAEAYDQFEVSIPWAAFGPGKYYITAEGNDPQFINYTAKSEPVECSDDWGSEFVLVEGYNNDNRFGIDYSTGIKHRYRVDATLSKPTFGSQRTVYKDSKARTVKLEDINSFHFEFSVFDSPPHLFERLDLMLSLDRIFLDDLECQCDEDFEPEYFDGDPLGNGKVKVVQVEYENENSHDSGEPDVDILGLDPNTVMGVL
jgi:hypothetical protein